MEYKWERTSFEVYRAIYNQHKGNLSVFEGYTEMNPHGDKLKAQITAWGFSDAEHPIIRSQLIDFDNWEYSILRSVIDQND